MCYRMCMPTTRRRVNLTLTEMEERFLDAITTPGTAEYDAVLRYLESQALGLGAAAPLGAGEVVHVQLRMSMDQLEGEIADISYAAEAAAQTPQDRARIDALRARLIGAVARADG